MAYPSDLAVDPSRGFISRLIIAGLLLFSSGALYGHAISAAASQQENSNAAQSSVPAAVMPGSAENSSIVLKDGQAILLRTTRLLSSEHEKTGNEVQFEVAEPVKVADLIVIAEHATALGKITKAERKRRRGIPGKLEISIERVQLVNGDWASLRAVQRKAGKGTGGEIAGNMIELTARTYLLGAPLAPVFLLQHGNDLVLPEAYRFTAFVQGDVVLDRAAVLALQSMPEARTDLGTVFVYRPHKDRLPELVVPVNCGEVQVAAIRSGQFIRLELPPGQYWFGAGGAGLAFGMHTPRGEYLPLNVEGGRSYYLRIHITDGGFAGLTKTQRPQLSAIESAAGAGEMREMDSSAERKLDKSWIAENVSLLQALPKRKEQQQPEQRSPSTPQESEQLGPATLFGQ